MDDKKESPHQPKNILKSKSKQNCSHIRKSRKFRVILNKECTVFFQSGLADTWFMFEECCNTLALFY
jgi:hypothetical protein